jgi:gluconolactonase
MCWRLTCAALGAALLPWVAAAQTAAGAAPAPAPTETTASEIPGVIKGGTKVELLKTGLSGTEGPIALPDGSLIFTEREANRITRLDARGQFSTYLESPNGTNSLSFDRQGRLIAVQWIKPRAVVLSKGAETVLADGFNGKPFGRPNDVVADAAGGVYLTDPGAVAPNKRAVFYITPARVVTLVTEDVEFPNGVALSPDEKTLYVANTAGEYIIAFDRRADGSVTNMRNFAHLVGPARTDGIAGVRSGADGLAVDGAGRLYVATTAGVQVFSATGDGLGTIPIGLSNGPQNLAFAGADKKTLYVIGRGALYRIRMTATGFKGRAK